MFIVSFVVKQIFSSVIRLLVYVVIAAGAIYWFSR